MEKKFRFTSAFIKDDALWCVPNQLNCLYKIQLSDWSVQWICDLDHDSTNYVSDIFLCNHMVWCVYKFGADISGYDMLSGNVVNYGLDIHKRENVGAVLKDGIIFIVPRELPDQMICYHTVRSQFFVEDYWDHELSRQRIRGRIRILSSNKSYIIMNILDKGLLFQYDFYKKRIKKIINDREIKPFYITCAKDECYIAVEGRRRLIGWNDITGELKDYECGYLHQKGYVNILWCQDRLLLYDGDNMDLFDLDTKMMTPYNHMPVDLKNDSGKGSLFTKCIKYKNKYFLLPWQSNMLLEMDENYETTSGHILKIPNEDIFRLYAEHCMRNMQVLQEDSLGLAEYIPYVKTLGNKMPDSIIHKEKKGTTIYRILKETLNEP